MSNFMPNGVPIKQFESVYKQKETVSKAIVTRVDKEARLVTIMDTVTRLEEAEVPYMFPFYGNGSGIIYTPTPGSLAIVYRDALGKPTILGFTASTTTSVTGNTTRFEPLKGPNNIPELQAGEILLLSQGKSSCLLENNGDATLASSSYSYVRCLESGEIDIDGTNILLTSNGVLKEKIRSDYEDTLTVTKGKHNINGEEVIYSVFVEGLDEPSIAIYPNGKVKLNTYKEPLRYKLYNVYKRGLCRCKSLKIYQKLVEILQTKKSI